MLLEEQKSPVEKCLFDLREHIVQIESFLIYILICMIALALALQSKYNLLIWAVAIGSLFGVGQVMRVRNPASRIRSRLINITTGAASGSGIGLTIDTAFGGMTLGAAAALGGVLGGIVGAITPISEAPAKEWLDWADAFKLLYTYRERDNRVANSQLIQEVLSNDIPAFEFTPGVKSYSVKDIKKFLDKRGHHSRSNGGNHG